MTWLIRVENPDMDSPNRILHGELCNKVSKIFEEAGQKIEKVGVSWVEPEKKPEDPYHGEKLKMTMWLQEYISSHYTELTAYHGKLTTVPLVQILRNEWMNEREFKGGAFNPYISLKCYADLVKQVMKGWGF